MDYVLTASVFHHRADGRRRRFERGDRLTGLSDRDVRRLLAAGAIAPAEPELKWPEDATEAIGGDKAEEARLAKVLAEVPVAPKPSREHAPTRPKQAAPKSVWVKFAVAKGFDRDEAESMSKPDLIQALG